ncbi:MAG: ABC transporter permease [Myxococcales bacterium]|nr:ABC transporter permease [Myxococcales bacterium]USN51827.1 MAG: ABC transporter permease [Myxococcales bacterium]
MITTLIKKFRGIVSPDTLESTGAFFRKKIAYLGGLTILVGNFYKHASKRPVITKELKEQCFHVGVSSMPIAAVTLFFVGVVFAFQFGITLRALGAVQFIGRVTTVSLVRELGPVFTALVVGGRIGAGMAAEIASMRVTEQIDAIRALGASPIRKLIVPRILAATFMIPLVSILATVIGAFGAVIISWGEFRVSPVSFYGSSIATVKMIDFISGFTKTFFFGFGIALVGCYEGLFCDFGTKGVGRATTRAVVNVSLVIVFTDFFLTRIFAYFL